MDEGNLDDLEDVRVRAERERGKESGKVSREEGRALARLHLFGEFGGKGKGEDIIDPYYGGGEGFEIAYEQCVRMSEGLLREVVKQVGRDVKVNKGP